MRTSVCGRHFASRWTAMALPLSDHDHFYPKKAQHGHHRFCRLCWPEESRIPESLTQYRLPGKELKGCCMNQASPGSMQRHLRRKHKIETVQLHEGAHKHGGLQESKGPVDPSATRDFAYGFVLKDLLLGRSVSKKGCRTFVHKHINKQIGSRRMIRTSVRK